MAKILITGGSGFLGYHLAKKLVSSPSNEIMLAARTLPKAGDDEFAALLSHKNIKIIQADLTNKKDWDKIGEGFDYVYHLVSIKGFKNFNEMPQEVLRVGITTTLNLLAWFNEKNKKTNAKILYTSSNEVYIGGLPIYEKMPNPTPENVGMVIPDTYDPRWSYAGQKLISELLFIHYSKAYNFRMSIVRPTNIYGPRAGFDGMIPRIIRQTGKHTNPFTILGPEDTRTFCFIDDAVDALIKVMEATVTDGQTYNIADNRQASVKEITELIFAAAGWHPEKIVLENAPREAVRNSLQDISKIKKDAAWEPVTSLQDGMKKTVSWYLAHLES